MPIIWSPESLDDLQALRIHIAVDDRAAASRMVMRIVDAVESVLAPHPDAGRPGRVPGTREFVVARSPYIVPYRVRNGALEIIRVFHGAQKWPDQL
jgi:toxin ParE1/3/4